jgi:hypothetical protein
MRSSRLAADYVHRAEVRVQALQVLFAAESWADVVRESQEIVELALKGLLRACGIEPPRIHDVSDVLIAERGRLPAALAGEIEALAEASRRLRRDRGSDAVGLLQSARRGGGQGVGGTHGRARRPPRPPRQRAVTASGNRS